MFLHDGAGFAIAATRPIPGLPRLSQARASSFTVHPAARPAWADAPWSVLDQSRAPGTGRPLVVVSRSGPRFRFEYADGTLFWIEEGASDVWFTWESTFEDACTYLTGPILAFALRARGELVLHASAVVPTGPDGAPAALLFAGPHGAGKSTTAAACARAGYPVVADDLVRLTLGGQGWCAHPFGTWLRLWPDAEQLVFGRTVDLPLIVQSWEKRALHFGTHGTRGTEQPVRVGAIALLQGRDPSRAAVAIDDVTAGTAMLRLTANSSANHLLAPAWRAAEFTQLAALAESTPCALVTLPDGSRLAEAVVELAAWATRRMHGG